VNPPAHLKGDSIVRGDFFFVFGQAPLGLKSCMTRRTDGVIVSNGSAEKSHNAIPCVLVYRSTRPMNHSPQYLEASIHDLINIFRVEFFCHGRKTHHISKEDRNQFSLTLQVSPDAKHPLHQKFRGVIEGRSPGVGRSLLPVSTTFSTLVEKLECNPIFGRGFTGARGEGGAALAAEVVSFRVIKVALRAFHKSRSL
jgi:hypothetical protein